MKPLSPQAHALIATMRAHPDRCHIGRANSECALRECKDHGLVRCERTFHDGTGTVGYYVLTEDAPKDDVCVIDLSHAPILRSLLFSDNGAQGEQ